MNYREKSKRGALFCLVLHILQPDTSYNEFTTQDLFFFPKEQVWNLPSQTLVKIAVNFPSPKNKIFFYSCE
jgi:hypothetical protein